jgi:tRNA (guanine37-N1)-methyltransferase
MRAIKILPGTGRGTNRRLVEGDRILRFAQPYSPFTVFDGPPPRTGED